MRTPAILFCAVVVALTFSSCHLKEKYARNEANAVAYLKTSQAKPAAASFKGVWQSPDWGVVAINQERNGKLSGQFGDDYAIRGVVSGKTAYLVLTADSWTHYTVELTKKNYNELTGFASGSVPFSSKDQEPLTLKRINVE